MVFLAGWTTAFSPLSRAALWEEDQLEGGAAPLLCGHYLGPGDPLPHLCQKPTIFGRTTFGEPSRFISEIPPELLIQLGMERKPSVAQPKAFRTGSEGYSVGERVIHGKFGQGTIVSVQGEGKTKC